jgi:hypothetical protein
MQSLRENNCQPRILYPAKLSFDLQRYKGTFQDKDKLKHLMSKKPALQKVLKGIFDTEEEENHSQIYWVRKQKNSEGELVNP